MPSALSGDEPVPPEPGHPDRLRWNARYAEGRAPSFTPHPLAVRALALGLPDGPVADLVRKDKRFKELGLNPANYADKKSVVALLLEHPELMQRPIVIRGKRAIIARPPKKLAALL